MADHARGERLRQLRSERGLSQEEVAHVLGVTAKTYGAWERGGGINPGNVRQVARYFKVKPAELITPEIEPGLVETVLSAEDVERLKRIEEKMDEILRRLEPAEPDDVPDALPDVEDPPQDETGEGEAETG